MNRLFLSFRRDQRGSSLIEFAFCASLMLMTVFGIMNVSQAIYVDHFVVAAARQGVRYAIVRGSAFTGSTCTSVTTVSCAATSANVVTYVKSLAPVGTSLARITVTPTWSGKDASGAVCINAVRLANTFGCVVTVTVSYSYGLTFPFLPRKSMALSSTSAMTISQ
jgi:Flp pilus assembly protein TadG